jgi:hypothetical protein
VTATIPGSTYVGKLDSVADIRKEGRRVYRATRQGKIPTAEGARLTYMLDAQVRWAQNSEEIEELKKLRAAVEAAQGQSALPYLPHDAFASAGLVNADPLGNRTPSIGDCT